MVHDINNGQVDFPYKWITTKDGSLTLKPDSEHSEWMHSLHGAYAESQYIYGDALNLSLQEENTNPPLQILSMGLGLGYLELITIFQCLKEKKTFKIFSFELDPLLKFLFSENCKLALEILNFNSSLEEYKNEKYYESFQLSPQDFYNHYLVFFINDYGKEIVKSGLELILSHNFSDTFNNPFLELKEALTPQTLHTLTEKYHLIFYDAFSSNSQSELWNEDFLTHFLHSHTDEHLCVLATYAKVGALTRALKKNQFLLLEKKGYAFKRESTLALRKYASSSFPSK